MPTPTIGVPPDTAPVQASDNELDAPADVKNEAVTVETLDKIEAMLDYIITRANTKRDLPGIAVYIGRIDDLWFVLKEAREKAGRPRPKI